MDLTKILEAIGQYGLPICMVVYFMYRDHFREERSVKREAEMIARIQSLEEQLRTLLVELVDKTSSIIVANSEAWVRGMEVWHTRPCLADELSKRMLADMVKLIKDAKDGKG